MARGSQPEDTSSLRAFSKLRASPLRSRSIRKGAESSEPSGDKAPRVQPMTSELSKAILLPHAKQLLKKSMVFEALTEEQFDTLVSLLNVELYPVAGKDIIRQGDSGDRLFIVLDGQAHAYVQTIEAKENLVKEYKPGEYFGELALTMANSVRRATVRVASANTVLLSLRRADFERTLGPYKELLLQNAAFRPADRAMAKAKELELLSPWEQLLGLTGGQKTLLISVCLYLGAGTAFYSWSGFEELETTSLVAGFYYSVETSLAVGFGKLTPKSAIAPFFTSAFVVAGATLLANFLSTLIADVIDNAEKKSEELRTGTDDEIKISNSISSLLVWWACGITFGMTHESWDLGKSVLFAVSATSSIGLQAIISDDDISLLFCAIYMLVGVPLYATVLANSSFLIAEGIIRNRQKQIRKRALLAFGNLDDESISDVFSMYDTEQRGAITSDQIPALLKFISVSKGLVATDRDVEFFLSEFDRDRKGYILQSDLVEGLRRWKLSNESQDETS